MNGDMRKYSLYATRKSSNPYPHIFAKVVCDARTSWIIVEGVLTYSELERCDLIYYGHNMTYERCMAAIERSVKRNVFG